MLTELFESKSDARRMVEQNAVSLNNEKITDKDKIITLNDFKDNELLIQKGKKKFIKLVI